jgi:sugar/nucleoside kinase (ribokinase family)
LYITSLNGESLEALPKILDVAYENKIKIAWNPGIAQLEKGIKYLGPIIKNTSVLLLNKEEALMILDEDSSLIERVMMQKLLDLGPKTVVVTDGEKGSYAADSHEMVFCPAAKSVYKESTGAGDTFGSTFIAGMIHGISMREAQKKAAINAASVVEHLGAIEGLLSRGEIDKRAKKMIVN